MKANVFLKHRENKQRLSKFSKMLSNKNKQRLWNVQNSQTSQFFTALLIKHTKCMGYNPKSLGLLNI